MVLKGKRVKNIRTLAEDLKNGAVLIYPTDTFYALGGNALSKEVLDRVYDLKERQDDKSLPMIAYSNCMALSMFAYKTESLFRLSSHFWPGPLTLVSKASKLLPNFVKSKNLTLAIRVPANLVARGLSRYAGLPLVSTSANLSGHPPCMCLRDIPEELLRNVDYAIDGGLLEKKAPSTIVEISGMDATVLRLGAVSVNALRQFIPSLLVECKAKKR